jgi:hypothetical protein
MCSHSFQAAGIWPPGKRGLVQIILAFHSKWRMIESLSQPTPFDSKATQPEILEAGTILARVASLPLPLL